jgi:HAD superfamily hydrolase (TIGR01509 family)
MMIKGLIFDFDGLILNTEETEYNAWEEIYQAQGTHLPVKDWAVSMGRHAEAFDVIGILEQATGVIQDREQLRSQVRARFFALLALEPARPGVKEYLDAAQRMGIKIALATSSDRNWVEGHLKRLDLWNYFDVVCTADDVSRVKPDPELFLLAAVRLQLKPEETIVFEDSANGILAAKAAGCFTIAVPHKLSNLNRSGPYDRVIESMANVPLVELVEKVNRLFE